ncbi:MAG: hypothetical protein VKK98_03655 [Cyanobacteriota bacterium]|nr:hypothetical protein [Cyanobacteriota bacterium]
MSSQRYPMAPLIRSTLVALYLALVLPLPWLAPADLRTVMAIALPAGLLLILALVSEQVELDDEGIRVGHPRWCSWLLRRGWQLAWSELSGITPVNTSQGGRVFYLRRTDGGACLLPQRVDRFDDFLTRVREHSGLDLTEVGRISPPWTYQLLAILSWLMVAAELGWLLRPWISP